MNTRYIDITVSDEYILGSGVFIGASGSHDDVVLRVRFLKMWSGLSMTACWRDARRSASVFTLIKQEMLMPGTSDTYLLPVPHEAKRYPGAVVFTVKGFDTKEVTDINEDEEEYIRTVEAHAVLTTSAEFIVTESGYDEDADQAQQPTPTETEQIQSELARIKDDISQAHDNAVIAKKYGAGKTFDDQELEPGDEAFHNNARWYASVAGQEAAQAAQDSASAYQSRQGADAAMSAANSAKEACQQILGVSFPAYPLASVTPPAAFEALANHSYWVTGLSGAIVITLGAPADNVDNEYRFILSGGDTADVTFTAPTGYTFKWQDDIPPVFQSGMFIEISVLLFPDGCFRAFWRETE